MATFSGVIGGILLITIVIPWFILGAFVVGILYAYSAAFYRSSARELKVFFKHILIIDNLFRIIQRLDAVLRSSLYSHFSESLSGLATIRAYGEAKRFRSDNERFIDVENRAYWLTVVNQVCFCVEKAFSQSLMVLKAMAWSQA